MQNRKYIRQASKGVAHTPSEIKQIVRRNVRNLMILNKDDFQKEDILSQAQKAAQSNGCNTVS